MAIAEKLKRRNKIKRRIRRNITGTAERPRLTVYRSNREIYAQAVDDVNNKSIVQVGSLNLKTDGLPNKIEQAKLVGKAFAEKAAEAGVTKVVFDRNGYLYHGRVKALADAVREAGIKL